MIAIDKVLTILGRVQEAREALGIVEGPIIAFGDTLIGGDLTGDIRGNKSIDIQTFRTSSNQVVGGESSIGLGSENRVNSDFSASIGSKNANLGQKNNIFGYFNEINGDNSSTIGSLNTLAGSSLFSFGKSNICYGIGGVFIGEENTSSGMLSNKRISIGFQNNLSSASESTALGIGNEVAGSLASAFGHSNTASGDYSLTIGTNNTASTNRSSAVGYSNTASIDNGTSAFGHLNTASGFFSSAFGSDNTASGYESAAIGYGNTASGFASTAFGSSCSASGSNSHAFGRSVSNSIANSADFGFIGSKIKTSLSGGILPITEHANTQGGSTLQISIQTPIINFKTVAQTNIFTVPTGYLFLMDHREIISTNVVSPATAPTIEFGNSGDSDAYEEPILTTSNSTGSRHIIENYEDGITGGTVITFGITSASTAGTHQGIAVIKGSLIKI